MGLIVNIMIMVFLIIIILFSLREYIRHNKKTTFKDPEECYKDCDTACDSDLGARYFDACKKKCARYCGS